MKIIKQSHQILNPEAFKNILQVIEAAGRTAYKSEDKITEGSAETFVRKIMKRGHLSVIEHAPMLSVRFITDRGVTHELVRHRLASFTQESTRYVNYKGKEMEFILPVWFSDESNWDNEIPTGIWVKQMMSAELEYNKLIKAGWSPQQARSVLPNSLKTEIVVTANLREWRHIFKLRTASGAHPQIVELMRPLLKEVREIIPIIFDDL